MVSEGARDHSLRHEGGVAAGRDAAGRARDHERIDRLIDEILPGLIDRLAAGTLGELEVREGDWRIRLRRPVAAPAGRVAGASAPAPVAMLPSRGAAQAGTSLPLAAGTAGVTAGTGAAAAGIAGPADVRGNGTGPGSGDGMQRVVANSPAVGIFQVRPDLRVGTRVRQGDRLGAVDLLGVPQDVVAPEDGIVVDTLATSGEGVEYGQGLVIIEPARPHPDGGLPAMPPAMES